MSRPQGIESDLQLTIILPPNAVAVYAHNATSDGRLGDPSLQNRHIR